MKKYKFLLDMDGVLCDFLSGALKALNNALNKDFTIKQYADNFGKWQTYDLYDISEDMFWHIIHKTPSFWINLNPLPWAQELYNKLNEIGDITVVTAPSTSVSCVTEKLDWLYQYFKIKPPDVFIGSKKHLMAGNGILIDDNRQNIEKFIAAGGEGILVPSNWNNSSCNFRTIWSHIENQLQVNEAHTAHQNRIEKIKKFESGMIRDQSGDKPRFDLITPLGIPFEDQMLTRWAIHMAKGAVHYSERNWEKASGPEELARFRESAFRHFMQWFYGNPSPVQNPEDHAAAVFFNITGYEMVKTKQNLPNKSE